MPARVAVFTADLLSVAFGGAGGNSENKTMRKINVGLNWVLILAVGAMGGYLYNRLQLSRANERAASALVVKLQLENSALRLRLETE